METVVIRGLAEGRAALERARADGRRVALSSIPDAALSAGPVWFAEIAAELARDYPDALASIALDCGDAAGAALGALRCGVAEIRYSGPRRAEMAGLAAALGARLADG